MPNVLEANLKPSQRAKLRRAREHGYLDDRGVSTASLLMAFSLWCWRLKLPVVWFERHSPRSRFGRVYLDLYTTANCLSAHGQAEMQGLAPGAVDISPHDACMSRVPLASLESLARRVLKAALRPGNCQSAAPRQIQVERRARGKLIELAKPRLEISVPGDFIGFPVGQG